MNKSLLVFGIIFISKLSFCFGLRDLGEKTIYPSKTEIDNDFIKTILLYSYSPNDNFNERYNNPAVLNKNNPSASLILEFDDLRAQYTSYSAKIIHCDYDWQKSQLSEMEYLDGFNEYFINTFEVSQNTKIPYYHYSFKVPKTKISGNFILQIFENRTEGEPLFEREFSVFEQNIGIDGNISQAQDPGFWRSYQQLNFKIEIGNYNVLFPQRDLKILIRQNQREDKQTEIDNQNLINSGRNTFTLKYFDSKNLIKAGNEFRFVDLSSSFRKSQNISQIVLGKPDQLWILPQEKRSNKAYLNAYDNDGGYLVYNLEGGEIDLNSDYIDAIFQLNIPYLDENEKPVIYGKLSNWDKLEMDFNPNQQLYEKRLLLKQGIYDFAFGKVNTNSQIADEDIYEGNFSDTGNTYEIFIYHKPPGARSEKLIGYQILKNNR
ncbi:DUF5103 domain-containing protein [Lacihabitans sp. LS3-19]|uniref:type IX secretion system plug protein n=1 Tax=Lacihabitans sp. LS3-19 TaxID=2487335 RepID=UPI0020CDBFBB|nr:type IX secretion system plug protein domain-containing protein [Lacihabitans sp. LS3-19]MCP9767431.1 DUF5103 domain-containing protein [Lacihabitans sp. LS3-19]